MRGEYEVEGDHCPRYSQKELDLLIEKAMDVFKANHNAGVSRLEGPTTTTTGGDGDAEEEEWVVDGK